MATAHATLSGVMLAVPQHVNAALLPRMGRTSAKALGKYLQQPLNSAGRYKTPASWWLLYFLPGPGRR